MAHIAGISAENAGQDAKLVFDYTRQGLAGITGREPERMLEPLEMYAHAGEHARPLQPGAGDRRSGVQ